MHRSGWRRPLPPAPPCTIGHALASEGARFDALLALASDYLVRFRPDATLAAIAGGMGALRERARAGLLSADELRPVIENALACLRVQIRGYRFPGIKFSKAMQGAIKSMHHERVTRSILGGAPYRTGPGAGRAPAG